MSLAFKIVFQIVMAWLGVGMQLYGPKPMLLHLHTSRCSVGDTAGNATLLRAASLASTSETGTTTEIFLAEDPK
jgi:hypothetical protein